MRNTIVLVLIWGSILITGCQIIPVDIDTDVEMTPHLIPVSPTQGNAQMTPSQPTSSDPALQGLIEAARENLSQRLNIPQTQINLIEAKSVIWPDSSVGCPQPGVRYKQVQEDGALIILQVRRVVYEYHAGGTRGLFLCEKNDKDPSTPPKLDIDSLTPP
ncbi:MAG TPA: hypothetical protein VK897_07845 [Anaerolineales bacterium]|nr:hypothetical protein [Anaerolineales bacterium]